MGVQIWPDGDAGGKHLHRLQSSPGYLHVGHVPSKWTWQMPQTSSSGMSHRQVATVFHFLMVTFMASPLAEWEASRDRDGGLWLGERMEVSG